MRNSDSPYLTDLFAISLRWLALFGFAISFAAGNGLDPIGGADTWSKIAILALSALWNGYLSVLAIFNRRFKWHRLVNVALDIIFAMLFFIAGGGYSGEVAWAALLPMFSSAIYFEIRGVMITAVIVSLLQGGYTVLVTGDLSQIKIIIVMTVINLGAASLVGLLNVPLMGQLRHSYLKTVTQRKVSEQLAKQQERDRMKALFEMIETFSSTLNYQTVMQTVLDTALDAVGTGSSNDTMVAAVMLFGEQDKLEIRASKGFIPADRNLKIPGNEGILKDILSAGEPRVLSNPSRDPELGQMLSLHEHQVALCIPLIRGMVAFGIIMFAHRDPAFFNSDRVETIQMLSNQAVISLQNARLYQDLDREKERLLQTQADEKKKLARALHDGPTQSVVAIAMRINVARRLLEQSTEEAEQEMARAEELARRTAEEIRHMLFMLRPLVLETEGLIAALQEIAQKMQDLYQQKIVIDADADVITLMDTSHQAAIFHLAEEAINNAHKHAQASEIWVRLKFLKNEDNIAVLEIIDNGIGFDVQSVLNSYDRRGSMGMINLRERTELINGLLKIDSIPGKGTCIRMIIPLNEDAADRLHNRRVITEQQ